MFVGASVPVREVGTAVPQSKTACRAAVARRQHGMSGPALSYSCGLSAGWAATNQQLNKEINDGAFMNKQEEYYLGRNVEKLMASDVVCSKVEVKEEVKPKGEQADNVGNKVDQGKQTGRGEQNLLTDQLRGNDQVKSVAKLQRGKILNRGKNPNKEERNRGRESDEAKDRRMVMNDQGEVGVQMNIANKKYL